MTPDNLVYRNAKEDDILGIATLCSNSFDDEFSPDALLSNMNSIENFRVQFTDRYNNYIKSGKKAHGMVVAETTLSTNDETSTIVGFAEIGMLPPPLSSLRLMKGDVPYLGNIAVASDFRRNGIGGRLVRIGMKIAQKWGSDCLFVVVKGKNTAALSLYSRLGFQVVLDESKGAFAKAPDVAKIYMAKNIA